jgi:hypothetical protein
MPLTRLLLLLVPLGCGSAERTLNEHKADQPDPERHVNYPVGEGGSPPCGWLRMPDGKIKYVACPSSARPSPISDQPEQDEDDFVETPTVSPHPDPPGDPPPM